MKLLVYKASAGSGKTFTLAAKYIKYLICDPRAYREILAVTFTNKATAEMKERIMQQLYGIWKGFSSSDVYLRHIEEELSVNSGLCIHYNIAEEEIRKRAGTALQNLLHDYSRFRVETIDSFFQSVIRNMARELELAPSLNIELDNKAVLNDAVDSMIEKLTPGSPVLAWLVEYINERIDNDKHWNVSNEIKDFGRNIFDENYIERGEKLRLKLHDPNVIRLYCSLLHAMEADALDQMKGFSKRFKETLESHGLETTDLKSGSRGISSYFNKLSNGILSDKDVQNVTLGNCLEDANNWATQTSPKRNEIINLAKNNLMPLLQEAEKQRIQKCRIVNSCKLSLRHLNKLQLLNHIDETVRELNNEQNRFLLSDTNTLLHRLLSNEDSSFIYEKIGSNIRHVMIDEFQDTSRMQWDNFRLLLLEGLSQGADSLIVGDVKQSIYRWRNGDWNILNNLCEEKTLTDDEVSSDFQQLNKYVEVETLRTNRRSETNLINFNNSLFTEVVALINERHNKELGEDCIALEKAYSDVVQESAKEEILGYVKGVSIKPGKDEDYVTMALRILGDEITRLISSGICMNDIAILVRKNKNIVSVAEYLRQELNLPIVSDEAFRLDASQAVTMLIDALRYLSDSDDVISAASLAVGYQKSILCNTGNMDVFLRKDYDSLLPPSFIGRLEELRTMPLYELMEELFIIFDMKKISGQDSYLFALLDSVSEYLKNNSSDIDSFIRFWDESLCGKTIPGGELDGIRVLSIHKSKGLEFHTVLIPFCEWSIENETNDQLVWCIPSEEPYNKLDLVPVSYSKAMAESVYRKEYLNERLQLWVDNLNLLYVAFTRAEKNLVFFSREGSKGTISELLYSVLPDVAENVEGVWNSEEGIFEYGAICPSVGKKGEETGLEEGTNKLSQKAERLPVYMLGRRYNNIRFRQSNLSADFIAGMNEAESNQRFLNRGRLLHALFSVIKTEDDIDNAIDRFIFEGIIGEGSNKEEIARYVRNALSLPQVKDWYSGRWQLLNERDIIWQEDGELFVRRPDRVMICNNEIVVIDFKFGKPNKIYNRQVREYMQLLERMANVDKHISGYLWYVDEKNIEQV